jgi:site-specific recombinase
MTGSALATALDQKNGLGAEIDLVASIARSQFIAAVGNVCVAIPAALVLDLAWRAITGHPLLDAVEGEHGLADLHPFRSLTLPFAAITGVFLFLSSLAAGLSANWSAFRSLSRAVSRSPRVRAVVGTRGAHWLAVQVGRHFSGIVAYVVLGFLLGFVPVLFKFAGVGLEVRHVTLSSAAMALDASALFSAGALQPGPLIWAGVGIVLIGALNFGVSFALALRVALQARGLVAVDRRRLVRGLLSALVRTPGRFLLPPRLTQASNSS